MSKHNVTMLTTVDNPFDPIDSFDDWFAFDVQQGYNTCSYIDRVAITSDELSDYENSLAIAAAIDEIIKYNVNGLYTKVTREID